MGYVKFKAAGEKEGETHLFPCSQSVIITQNTTTPVGKNNTINWKIIGNLSDYNLECECMGGKSTASQWQRKLSVNCYLLRLYLSLTCDLKGNKIL